MSSGEIITFLMKHTKIQFFPSLLYFFLCCSVLLSLIRSFKKKFDCSRRDLCLVLCIYMKNKIKILYIKWGMKKKVYIANHCNDYEVALELLNGKHFCCYIFCSRLAILPRALVEVWFHCRSKAQKHSRAHPKNLTPHHTPSIASFYSHPTVAAAATSLSLSTFNSNLFPILEGIILSHKIPFYYTQPRLRGWKKIVNFFHCCLSLFGLLSFVCFPFSAALWIFLRLYINAHFLSLLRRSRKGLIVTSLTCFSLSYPFVFFLLPIITFLSFSFSLPMNERERANDAMCVFITLEGMFFFMMTTWRRWKFYESVGNFNWRFWNYFD